ncbi:MAG: STT3 domain-containing protein [archaeon]
MSEENEGDISVHSEEGENSKHFYHSESSNISVNEEIKRRKEKIKKYFKAKPYYLVYVGFLIIALFGYYIRTLNLPYLAKEFPLALDPFIFLRYAQYVNEYGSFPAIDMLRYYPIGWTNFSEFRIITYFIVYLYKFLHLFIPSMTLEYAHILYPPIMFIVGAFFFFLLVKKIFDWRVGLLSTAFLTVIPLYLYRTMAGFSDKEAFAMAIFFLALYLFVVAMMEKNLKTKLVYGFLGGCVTAIVGLSWGGVTFLFLIIGSTVLIELLLNKFPKDNYYTYLAWFIPLFIILQIGYPSKYALVNMITSWTTVAIFVALFVATIHFLIFDLDLFKIKKRIHNKIPHSVFTFGVSILIGLIFVLIVLGPSFIVERMYSLIFQLTQPFATDRWSLTVAEAHQPYFMDIVSQVTWKYVWMFLAGAVLLFYEAIKHLKKYKFELTALFAFCLAGFAFNRYSSSSIFNGTNNIAIVAYFGSVLVFASVIFYFFIKSYYSDRDFYNSFKKIQMNYIFILVWFFFMLIAARSAIRLLFVLAPITAVLAAYLAVKLSDYALKLREDVYKISAIILIGIIIVFTLYSFSNIVINQAKYTGPSYNAQWQTGMTWVRENTPEDSVFAHWWDYGYWVQTGGQRATLSDGGNSRGAINYFIGRHVLTGKSETEALELLAANEADYLLIISDEIGKYPAFSSIGSDANYDRYSWISTFNLDMNNIQETRDEIIYLYTGGTTLDDDFTYQDQLFPSGIAGIGGFFLPTKNVASANEETGEIMYGQQIQQPTAVMFNNGIQSNIPLKRVYMNGQLYEFEGEGLGGALVIIPYIDSSGETNPIGSSMYISEEVYNGLFAQLYLFENYQEYPHFKLAYSDENIGWPLAYYAGRLIGPMKIWEISYPDDLVIPEEYYGTELPDLSVLVI